MSNTHNRIKVLAQILSVDAWHDPFTIDQSTSGVYVEVSFREGRIGGDDSSFPFTFRMALKRALLTVHVESPLVIDRSTVARSIPKVQAELLQVRAAKGKTEAHASAGGRISSSTLSVDFGGAARTGSEKSNEEELRISQTVPEIIVNPIPKDGRSYCWELEHSIKDKLEGQPWHPVEEPRLRVRSPDSILRIEPSVKVIISCALEDLIIEDIQLKKRDLVNDAKELVFPGNNLAAAVQHLKKVLLDADLDVAQLDDRFSQIILANVLASEG